jgi:HlyD family secretion protein
MDRKIEKKKGIRPKHIIMVVSGLIVLFLLVKMIQNSSVSSVRVENEKITISEVEFADYDDFIRTNGTVEPISIIYLDAEEGGRVKERLIEEGAMVKKGDVILELENRSLYENIMNSESNLAQKQNMLRQTRINFESQRLVSQQRVLDSRYDIVKNKRYYEQQKTLFDKDLVSRDVYLEAKENYEHSVDLFEINQLRAKNDSLILATEMIQLDQELKKMEKTLALIYERLDDLKVKAPVDGQLGMLDAEIGQSIAPGARIGQINVLTDFKIVALIDEHYIDRVRRDLAATFERQEKLFNLSVKKVYPEVRNSQFEIDLIFTSERPENIRAGQTYYINLQLGEPQKSLLVSLGAFFNSTGGQWIYVVDSSGKFATKRSIKIGRKNPKYYEVLEGLEKGEKVITSGYDLFGDNEKLILK